MLRLLASFPHAFVILALALTALSALCGFYLHYISTSNFIPNPSYYIKLSDVRTSALDKVLHQIFGSELKGFALIQPQEH